ncbi:envelope biogenesis lipoprotein LpqN [Mycobacterium sp. C3-094]|uniref:LpqN/LpqT family lipoprotein n=1 Tax=Mycobacterium sp. PSTR-4-N TaxID=2917745 RepID=UPI001F156101|nr:LpqN/LpqT family lipoprotein [Mycobacterium sp. PSTR-4-N]MCG7593021.1 LpqN/LpqT family lipoprotein [Mycobacterium sp. PSTR-4-N]
MTTSTRAGLIALAVLTLGGGLSACSNDTSGTPSSASSSATSSVSSTAQAAPPSSSAAPAPIVTLADYIRDNNIVETPVAPGDPGSPTIELPTLEGWEDMGGNAPEGSYSASVFTGDPAAAADPATVITKVVKLTGNVDPAKVLEVAPGELRALPGFDGPESGVPNKLSGFDATVIGGTYTKDGAPRMVAQKTVVIPGQEGLYVLQINAEGTPEQANALMDATAAIDDQATITP